MRNRVDNRTKKNFIREETLQDVKEYKPQWTKTQTEGGEKLIAMLPAISKGY